MTSATVGLIYKRTPDPAWVERLTSILGDNPKLPSLWLHWEPGDEWGPRQRWLFFQTWPIESVKPEIVKELKGPHPRSAGHFDPDYGHWIGGPCSLITRSQWEIYRACGRFARPWWVVQGHHGGHKLWLNKWESKLSQLMGGPKDTPDVGDLPYAEPDERTWAAIAAADRVRQYEMEHKDLHYVMRRPFEYTAAEKHVCQLIARQILNWAGVEFTACADELAWALKNDSTIPRPVAGTEVKEEDEDEVMHRAAAELVREMDLTAA